MSTQYEQKVFFQNLKQIKEYWLKISKISINEQSDLMWSQCEKEYEVLREEFSNSKSKEAYANVIDELFTGLIHSLLVMFDGGDALSDKFNIDIINADTGESIKNNIALNEEFLDYF